MKLFVGLGNPGSKHAANRHNVGFMAVDRIAEEYGFGPWRKKFQGMISDGLIDGSKVLLLKPQTYMNESGRSVAEAARFHKCDVEDVFVFYDEIDLVPGKLKAKTGGGNAGHNGLRSISAQFDNDYHRVRIGVGHPGRKGQVANYVLRDFSKADKDWLEPMLDAIAAAAPQLVEHDVPGFLSDVARRLHQDDEPAEAKTKRSKSESDPDKNAKPRLKKPSPAHPAGSRMAHRQSALAENLAKWLKKTKPDE